MTEPTSDHQQHSKRRQEFHDPSGPCLRDILTVAQSPHQHLLTNKHVLLCFDDEQRFVNQIEQLKQQFCGLVIVNGGDEISYNNEKLVYLCGNMGIVSSNGILSLPCKHFFVIKDISYHFDQINDLQIQIHKITVDQVPINVFGCGVFVRQFFDTNKDFFRTITKEHNFQSLTESTKPGHALRKGIYITQVNVNENNNDTIDFSLLRCSSNFEGPTDNLRSSDHEILNSVNQFCGDFFNKKVDLNHVLAQVYEHKENKKAKIKAHSDKTKDMAKDGLMAFCSFYNQPPTSDSALTQLVFRLKPTVEGSFVKRFDIILHPHSLFVIPLLINRLYTHEIKPSILSTNQIPIRLGYVIRCSNTKARFQNGSTFIQHNNNWEPLLPINDAGVSLLRKLYFDENATSELIEYPFISFSMNAGDYMKPLC